MGPQPGFIPATVGTPHDFAMSVRETSTMVIYKYELRVTDVQIISMPKGARVLHVGNQHEHLCVWAVVDPSQPMIRRGFAVFGTGQLGVPQETDDVKYIGSVQMRGGALVRHVFDVGEEPTK
jgi:hypothetical protein